MYCIEEKACAIAGTFRRRPPSDSPPAHCAALATPLMWHFATNCAAVKFAEPWRSKHFFELREHNHVSSAKFPECPTKDWWGNSCWLNPWESGPNVIQGPGGVTSSPTLLGPVFVWRQQNYLKLLLIVKFSKSSYGCCPRRNRTFQSGRFGLAVSVWAVSVWAVLVWAVSVWPFRSGDISVTSVHKQLIAFVYFI